MLMSLAYFTGLFVIPVVAYLVFIKEEKNKKYNQPAWYFHGKKILCHNLVKKYLKEQKEKFNIHSFKKLETPKRLCSELQEDVHSVTGIDSNGNAIFIKFTTRLNKYAEILIHLRLENGKLYELPECPLLCAIQKREWKAAGLRIEVGENFRIYRIAYNGFLKCQDKVEHFKINFIWSAASKPIFYPGDAEISSISNGICRETWRDGKWLKFLSDQNGYDQYGLLHGEIKSDVFKNGGIEELRIPCCRRRVLGGAPRFGVIRNLEIFAATPEGTLISIGAECLKRGCSLLSYGSVLYSNGDLYPISEHDGTLEELGEIGLPKTFVIHVTTTKSTIKCVFHINEEKMHAIESKERSGWEMTVVEAECDVDTTGGKAIIKFWYSNEGEGVNLPSPLLKPNTQPSVDFILPFEKEQAKNLSLSGGKGTSLALLASVQKNFAVPEGFIITTTSFKKQIERKPKIEEAISAIGGDLKQIKSSCQTAVEVISNESVTEEVSTEIKSFLKEFISRFGDEEIRWAVRSSGVDEDSDDLSAAGQNETILGCKSEEDVLKAVAKCWASLYTFQSVQYRIQNGLSVKADMAVVIQRMIPSDTAGVLFTCDPSDGNGSRIVITANYGLGESVVSAMADPDSIVVRRNYPDDLKIELVTIGEKKEQIVMDEVKTKTIDVPSELSKQLCLSDENILKLAKIGIDLEKKFGNHRDIEWAFYNDKLYILQSRAVTTVSMWTDYELENEFNCVSVTESTIYTTGNVKEVLPGAVTIATSSFVCRIIESGTQVSTSGEVNPHISPCVPIIKHHVFLDVINTFWKHPADKVSIKTMASDLAILGRKMTDEHVLEVARKRNGKSDALIQLKLIYHMIKSAWNAETSVKEAKKCGSYEIGLRKNMTLKEMYSAILDYDDVIYQISIHHNRASEASTFFQITGLIALGGNSEEYNNDHYHDIALMLSSCSNVISAEIPIRLEAIAALIRNSSKSEQFLKISPHDGPEWMKENVPEAYDSFKAFMEMHGHRSFREFELMEKSWALKPEVIIGMIQANSKAKSVTKKAATLSADDTLKQLKTPLNWFLRFLLNFLITKGRKAVGRREATKSEFVRVVNKMRGAFKTLGDKLVEEGRLPGAELVYFLSKEELKRLTNERDPGLVKKATRRARLYKTWDQNKFEEVIHGYPKPKEIEEPKYVTDGSEVVLKGTPVCTGEITARCCNISSLSEIDELKSGDILITHSTDIGWSPYFPMLSGIVTELGGLISHGAVVAREYGLPSLIGVQNATLNFKTGDLVTLSGKTGTLRLIERQKSN